MSLFISGMLQRGGYGECIEMDWVLGSQSHPEWLLVGFQSAGEKNGVLLGSSSQPSEEPSCGNSYEIYYFKYQSCLCVPVNLFCMELFEYVHISVFIKDRIILIFDDLGLY